MALLVFLLFSKSRAFFSLGEKSTNKIGHDSAPKTHRRSSKSEKMQHVKDLAAEGTDPTPLTTRDTDTLNTKSHSAVKKRKHPGKHERAERSDQRAEKKKHKNKCAETKTKVAGDSAKTNKSPFKVKIEKDLEEESSPRKRKKNK